MVDHSISPSPPRGWCIRASPRAWCWIGSFQPPVPLNLLNQSLSNIATTFKLSGVQNNRWVETQTVHHFQCLLYLILCTSAAPSECWEGKCFGHRWPQGKPRLAEVSQMWQLRFASPCLPAQRRTSSSLLLSWPPPRPHSHRGNRRSPFHHRQSSTQLRFPTVALPQGLTLPQVLRIGLINFPEAFGLFLSSQGLWAPSDRLSVPILPKHMMPNFWGRGKKQHKPGTLSIWANSKYTHALCLLTSKKNRIWQLGLFPTLSNASQASTCFYCYSYASEINSMEKNNVNWQQLTKRQPNKPSSRSVRVERF